MTSSTKLMVRAHDETGASLILALIFIVVVSVIMLALTSLATNGLSNVAQFRSAQLERSAIDSAMNTAIYQERHTVTTQSIGATPVICTPTPSITISEPLTSGYTFQIWCTTIQQLALKQTRTVTFSECLLPNPNGTSSVCPSPVLVAQVVFDDYSFPVSQILTKTCTVNCGTTEIINSWVLQSTQ